MSKVEVLVSCMNQVDLSLVDKINIKTDAILINQNGTNDYLEKEVNGQKLRMFSSDQKGLSRSRNFALNNAKGDICLLCDDDVTYVDDYKQIVIDAFEKLPDADIIVFNTNLINAKKSEGKQITKIKKSRWYQFYGSVRIAFRLKNLQKSNVWFNTNFGAGSIYGAGEESILLREARRKGLKVFEYPATIADVDYAESSWFTGFNEKYFYDKGAFLTVAFPFLKYLFMFYYIKGLKSSTKLSVFQMIKWLSYGMRGYEHSMPIDKYCEKKSSFLSKSN